jgi:hypothetical protein
MPPFLPRATLALAVAAALGFGLAACNKPAADATPAATAAAAAPTAEQVKAESARLNAWFEKKYEEQLQFSPIQLTMLGRKELYDQIDDMSEAGMRRAAGLAGSVGEGNGNRLRLQEAGSGNPAVVRPVEKAVRKRPRRHGLHRQRLSVRADGRRAEFRADLPDQFPQGRGREGLPGLHRAPAEARHRLRPGAGTRPRCPP